MANDQAANYLGVASHGTYGNAQVFVANVDLTAAPGGQEVKLAEMGESTYLNDLRISYTGAMPAMTLGWRYRDGSAGGAVDALQTLGAGAADASVRGTFIPIKFDKDVIITATLGGAATGKFDVVFNYEYLGNL